MAICLSTSTFSCSNIDDEDFNENFPGNTVANPSSIEIPKLKGGSNNLFVSHSTKIGNKDVTTYSMEYDCSLRHARWVAFTFYNTTATNTTGRTEAWANDPDIPAQYRSTRDDYRGYDRGHICASADRVYSVPANEQTFYYSNMSPQMGGFNQRIWADLENRVREWGRSNSFRDTLYVVKGGTIEKNQLLKYTGPNNIPVPKYYYMAFLCKKGSQYKAISFWLEHKTNYQKPYNFANYVKKIDELETLTGIDFFHNLPDEIESKVESTTVLGDWNL
ncbi:MAG: DNA/RNA non-specific endonuclease [Bacteroidaceae bacterium]